MVNVQYTCSSYIYCVVKSFFYLNNGLNGSVVHAVACMWLDFYYLMFCLLCSNFKKNCAYRISVKIMISWHFNSKFLQEVEDLPEDINITYFGVFDGHAGSGAAVMASHTLHHIILEKLASIQYFLMNSTIEQRQFTRSNDNRPAKWPFTLKDMSVETMVIGALEKAFIDMVSNFEHRSSVINLETF